METLDDLAIAPLAAFRAWLSDNPDCRQEEAGSKIGEIVNKYTPSPEDILACEETDPMMGELLRFLCTKYQPAEAAGELSKKARGVIGFALWEEWRSVDRQRRGL